MRGSWKDQLHGSQQARTRVLRLAVGVCLALLGSIAFATETITYTYDALGRLVTVSHSGSVNNGTVATYTYDAADNRSNVTVTGVTCGGGAGWDPAQLFSGGAQGAWYDPSDLSSMWQDSAGTTPAAVNEPVGRINDKSGNGNHLTQGTAAKRPVLRSLDGFYWLEFDGIDDVLVGGDVLDLRQNSMWAVIGAKIVSRQYDSFSIFAKSLYGAAAGRHALGGTPTTVHGFMSNQAGDIIASGPDTSTAARVLTLRNNRSTGSLTVKANATTTIGSASFTPDTAQDHNTGFRFLVGAYNNSSDTGEVLNFNGNFYGLILKQTSTLSEADLTHAEGWMSAKAGVSL